METENLIATVAIGLIFGVLYRVFVKIGSMGIIGDVVVGIGSALTVAFMFPTIGLTVDGGLIETIVLATGGAIAGLFFLKKAKTA